MPIEAHGVGIFNGYFLDRSLKDGEITNNFQFFALLCLLRANQRRVHITAFPEHQQNNSRKYPARIERVHQKMFARTLLEKRSCGSSCGLQTEHPRDVLERLCCCCGQTRQSDQVKVRGSLCLQSHHAVQPFKRSFFRCHQESCERHDQSPRPACKTSWHPISSNVRATAEHPSFTSTPSQSEQPTRAPLQETPDRPPDQPFPVGLRVFVLVWPCVVCRRRTSMRVCSMRMPRRLRGRIWMPWCAEMHVDRLLHVCSVVLEDCCLFVLAQSARELF